MDPAAILRGYLSAYEARDLGAIEALLAADARLQDWNVSVHGRAAVLAETRRNFEAATSLSITVLRILASATAAAAQLRILVDGTIELEVVDVIDVDASGRIVSIRAFKG